MGQKTSFYISDELSKIVKKYIERYGSLSKFINYAILSMDTMYRIERRFLRDFFTQPEIKYIIDKFNFMECIPQITENLLSDFIEDDLKTNFEELAINREVILKKSKELTLSQQYALLDWINELKKSKN